MLESLEGRRGEIRVRPPLPAEKGLFGAPTIVNNVITLATVPTILANGATPTRSTGRRSPAARCRCSLPATYAAAASSSAPLASPCASSSRTTAAAR